MRCLQKYDVYIAFVLRNGKNQQNGHSQKEAAAG